MNTVTCEHLDSDSEWPSGAFGFLPLGESRKLWLCSDCWTRIQNMMIARAIGDVLHEDIQSDIMHLQFGYHEMV